MNGSAQFSNVYDDGAVRPQFVRWTTTNVWNNDEDPAELYDADGHLVAEHR